MFVGVGGMTSTSTRDDNVKGLPVDVAVAVCVNDYDYVDVI